MKDHSTVHYPNCNKRFAEKKIINGHIRLHSDERPYACTYPQCGIKFKSNSRLRGHKLVHSIDRPYTCIPMHSVERNSKPVVILVAISVLTWMKSYTSALIQSVVRNSLAMGILKHTSAS